MLISSDGKYLYTKMKPNISPQKTLINKDTNIASTNDITSNPIFYWEELLKIYNLSFMNKNVENSVYVFNLIANNSEKLENVNKQLWLNYEKGIIEKYIVKINETESVVKYDDYKTVNGFKFPFKIHNISKCNSGSIDSVSTYSDIIVDIILKDEDFVIK